MYVYPGKVKFYGIGVLSADSSLGEYKTCGVVNLSGEQIEDVVLSSIDEEIKHAQNGALITIMKNIDENCFTIEYANGRHISNIVTIRDWSEFVESSGGSFIGFLRKNPSFVLTPKYKIFSRKLWIRDGGRYYSGLTVDIDAVRGTSSEVVQSTFSCEELCQKGFARYIRESGPCLLNGEEIVLVICKNSHGTWPDLSAVLRDSSLWMKPSFPLPPPVDGVLTFREWISGPGKEDYGLFLNELKVHAISIAKFNESPLWTRFASSVIRANAKTGNARKALQSVGIGIEVRSEDQKIGNQKFFGLPRMSADGYWPTSVPQHRYFSARVSSCKKMSTGSVGLDLQECKDIDSGEALSGLEVVMHQFSPDQTEGLKVGDSVFGLARIEADDQIRIVSISMEKPGLPPDLPVPLKPEDGYEKVVWDADEMAFLDGFREYVMQECGFKYDPRDLVRFHTSVKCGALVVLGGAPGVGKSSLVELYGRYVCGERFSDCFLGISVSSAWTEPADILGYKDFKNDFRDATCGLAKFLRRAQNSENGVFPVCLEEMNLACAEHYFSDFIQIVDRSGDRELKGYESAGLDDKAVSPPKLCVSSRVRFIGTCNFDETTRSFSSRFYDRCSYLELTSEPIKSLPRELPVIRPYSANQSTKIDLNNWVHDDKDVLASIDDLYGKLCEVIKPLALQPSPRVAMSIRRYVVSRPPWPKNESDMSVVQRNAFDEALAQRVLSKYRPSLDPDMSSAAEALRNFLTNNQLVLSAGVMKSADERFRIPSL